VLPVLPSSMLNVDVVVCSCAWSMFANQQSHVTYKICNNNKIIKIYLPGSGTYGTRIHFEKRPLPDSLMGRQYPR
jgi:hypothetical protein